ncbi:MAG: glycoside hydrolase family 88 protein [Chitinophagaceae bacterium]|nr:glycoside hydrolase family 88 protein [Chitinophagaceae bacterium]
MKKPEFTAAAAGVSDKRILQVKKFFFILSFGLTQAAFTQSRMSTAMAETVMKLWPDSFLLANDKTAKWRYDQGVMLKGMEGVWYATGEGKWFAYIQKCLDFYVQPDGNIKGYKSEEYNLDHLNNGKLLLLLYRVTQKEKYKKAADLLRKQLQTHPRTSEGGFWHKKIYPNQMWLDGLYMAQPFYAEYAMLFHEDTVFNDVARQFILMEKHARDEKTGLLYHGWDESKQERWADKQTGRSSNFWGRSLGWFGMALVDVLDYFPQHHPQRNTLTEMLQRLAAAIVKVQDKHTGIWYNIPNYPDRKGNYPESSASCMFTYFLAKGVRKGYLPDHYMMAARKAYEGILKTFVEKDASGQLNLKNTVAVSGLGGHPYRDGSFEYYISEPVVTNDPKGLGAFIKCAVEMEMSSLPKPGRGKQVVLDYYFNYEWKPDITGKPVQWHYTWEDKTNSGFSLLKHLFEQYGARTASMHKEPDAQKLRNVSVYIIVDPDTPKETDTLHVIQKQHIQTIARWVKQGGVLVLLGNDAGNAELKNLSELSGVFGIRFNEDNKNLVKNDAFHEGEVITEPGNPVFGEAYRLFIKEFSSLSVKAPAKPLVRWKGDVVMAFARYGKGWVFALGDPWIYNEYLDGRKLPDSFQNYPAACRWVQWLLQNAAKR